ncbi:hypothetical protein OQX61_03605 [Pedobacter sp. PLR]|uniref:hypothetical protein n=1 Tax=Pedobacter sp. PLR TaxID=2994465 RepID=UPI002245DB23|nr:hypothetical protein [Pedobacter sp. PLR]MCX2450349.1 hypothetical protein [Pedobacter sp. PLR]
MKRRENKLRILFCSVLCLMSMSSCKTDGTNLVLERGKPIDLAQVDFRKLDLDKFLAKLAYVKRNRMTPNKHINTGTEPLIIKPFFLYNITEERLLKRYEQNEVDTIKKGEAYGDLYFVERRAPLIGMKDPDLRSFGYWDSKTIMFNELYTSSTAANKLIKIRLQTANLHNTGLKEYNALFQLLKAHNKAATFKEQPQSTGVTNYEWLGKDKVIQLNFAKADDSNFFELIIAYLNPDIVN